MSNLIKGCQTLSAKPFVFDANKSKVIEQIDETITKTTTQQTQDLTEGEQEFVFGLQAEQVEVEPEVEFEESDIEDAHQAALIIEEAYVDADQIRRTAAEEAENFKQQGIDEGKELGFQQGLNDAKEEIERQRQQLEIEYRQKEQQLENEYQQKEQQLEPKFANVLADLLQKLTGVSYETDLSILEYLIRCAILEEEPQRSYTIQLSKEDYESHKDLEEKIQAYIPEETDVQIVSNMDLVKGDCIIDTDNLRMDVGIHTQTDRLIKQLMMLS